MPNMPKIWLKSPDPSHQCCGCEGKTGPCDPCSTCNRNLQPPFASLATLQTYLANTAISCVALREYFVPSTPVLPPPSSTITYSSSSITFDVSSVFTYLSGTPGFGTLLYDVEITTLTNFSINLDFVYTDPFGAPPDAMLVGVALRGVCDTVGTYSLTDVNFLSNSITLLGSINNVTPGNYTIEVSVTIFNGRNPVTIDINGLVLASTTSLVVNKLVGLYFNGSENVPYTCS